MATNTSITTSGKASGGGLSGAWLRLQSLRPGDAGTAARARMRIQKAMGAAGADVRASVVGGYVELRGTVPTKDASAQAAEVARGVHGARGVLNFLDVR
ncbi:MAG: BON domain-containing protein [Dehalococcoidia bacterium]